MRLKITITGTVQGVGFRPFIYRLAKSMGLNGYVLNNLSGVTVEVEGDEERLREFLLRVEREKPPISKIYSLEYRFLDRKGYRGFEIRESENRSELKALIMPDIATCEECLGELYDTGNRRYRYPFINCTNCGPRYTIIERLPYDRKNTTMKIFKMCPECSKEYKDPMDRRFHAQPNACPVCGPHVFLEDKNGKRIAERDEAIRETVRAIEQGKIVAIKGLGGFHLVCDAANSSTVKELRRRKNREEKPLAVMVPNISWARKLASISLLEERALTSIERPIVILKKTPNCDTLISRDVSPDNTTVGLFLPYTPLHHLILKDFGKPVVATSANLTDEPIAKENEEAVERLSGIADLFLMHNRPIRRRCDDSVVTVICGRQVPIRRSRGFAPLPVTVPFRFKKPVLALGPYMKNTIAVGIDDRVFMSQHIGDLDNTLATDYFKETLEDLLSLLQVEPEIVVCDKHPLYFTTKFGSKAFPERLVKVQHHHAHVVSCMVENELPPDEYVIGFAFDGTGYGDDGTIWGGEVLIANVRSYRRVYHLKPFPLPGGDKAVKEPYRTAISLLISNGIEPPEKFIEKIGRNRADFIAQMVRRRFNSPMASSMGRVFDAVSSLLFLRDTVSFHAQAAIMLEQASAGYETEDVYRFSLRKRQVDLSPMLEGILADLKAGAPKCLIAKKFHNTIAELIVDTAVRIHRRTGISKVVLSGGVFQNRVLTKKAFDALKGKGLNVYIHQTVPPNDGGISLGQAAIANFIKEEISAVYR